LAPSKRLQNVKSSNKIGYTQGLQMCGTQPDNINSELGNLFPSRKKFQDGPRQYGKRASAWAAAAQL
jgi:hypothetical protein